MRRQPWSWLIAPHMAGPALPPPAHPWAAFSLGAAGRGGAGWEVNVLPAYPQGLWSLCLCFLHPFLRPHPLKYLGELGLRLPSLRVAPWVSSTLALLGLPRVRPHNPKGRCHFAVTPPSAGEMRALHTVLSTGCPTCLLGRALQACGVPLTT